MQTNAVVHFVLGEADIELGRIVADADLTLVDSLARMQLAAMRLGGTIVLTQTCADLKALLALVGLGQFVR